MTIFRTLGNLLLVVFFQLPCIHAADVPLPCWPQFHGPRRDNRATESQLLHRWPEGGPRRLWTACDLGHGFASLSIADGLIFTAGNIGERTVITALDLNGQLRWRTDNGKAWSNPVAGARGTPTVEGDRLYHENAWGDLVCLDTRTGRRLWGLNILERFGGQNITWGLSESVLIDGNHVICCPGGQTAVAALDKKTGEPVWKSASAGDAPGYASPALGEHRGLRLIFTLTSQAVIAVNADTGTLMWRYPHATPFGENILMPIFYDGHLFISTRTTGSVLLALTVDGNRCRIREVWRSKDLDNQHGGTILLSGHLYGSGHVNTNGKWACLDWKTGRTAYLERGVGKGSLTYADGHFYMVSESGTVGLVRARPERYDLISKFEMPRGGKGHCWAHPVVCGRRLYLRHGDLLHAYDVGAN